MTKSQLRETIRSIISRKLSEQVTISHGENGKIIDATESTIKSSSSKYAYIVDKKNPTDPRVQLIGYGNMPLSQLKKKCIEQLNELVKYAEQDRYDSVIGKWDDITNYIVRGLDELMDKSIEEDTIPGQVPQIQVNVDSSGKPMNPNDQKKIDDLETEKTKTSTELETIKGQLATKTKPFTDKINKAEKKLANLNTAIERIRQ